ncbi:MAG: hypothetical protein ACFFC7_34795, partial [Candidatus Hermodarchaeota archaeon]
MVFRAVTFCHWKELGTNCMLCILLLTGLLLSSRCGPPTAPLDATTTHRMYPLVDSVIQGPLQGYVSPLVNPFEPTLTEEMADLALPGLGERASKTVPYPIDQSARDLDIRHSHDHLLHIQAFQSSLLTSLPSRSAVEYQEHTPISINGNADFLNQASGEGWNGTGTAVDPIIIAHYNITNASRPLLEIKNTDL